MRALAEKETPAKIFQTRARFSGYACGMTRQPEDIPLLFPDPVIEAYLKDVDRTILRANLQIPVEQRFERFEEFARLAQSTRASAIARNLHRAA